MTATETLDRLRARLAQNEWTLKPGDRSIINGLLDDLEQEISGLEFDEAVHEAHREEIHNAMRVIDVVVHQGTSSESDAGVLGKLREALEITVDRVAVNHPVIAGAINRIGRFF